MTDTKQPEALERYQWFDDGMRPRRDGAWVKLEDVERNATAAADSVSEDAAHPAEAQQSEAAALTALPAPVLNALRFYARGEHFALSDETAWDTVSGEPPNFWCDEAGTATVEDGSIAKMVLRGQAVEWEEPESPIEGEAFTAAPIAPEPKMGGQAESALPGYEFVARNGGVWMVVPPTGDQWTAFFETPTGNLISAIVEARAASQSAEPVALTQDKRSAAAKAMIEVFLGFPAPDREPCDLDLRAVDTVAAVLAATPSAATEAQLADWWTAPDGSLHYGDGEQDIPQAALMHMPAQVGGPFDTVLASVDSSAATGAQGLTDEQILTVAKDEQLAAYPDEIVSFARAILAQAAPIAASPAPAQGSDARDAARYRFIKDNWLILSGGAEKFGWPIAPFGDQCDKYIDAVMSREQPKGGE